MGNTAMDNKKKELERPSSPGPIRCWPVSVRNLSAVFVGDHGLLHQQHISSKHSRAYSIPREKPGMRGFKIFPAHR